MQAQHEELQGRCEKLKSRVQALQQRCSEAEASTVSLELQVGLLQQRLRASTAQVAEQVGLLDLHAIIYRGLLVLHAHQSGQTHACCWQGIYQVFLCKGQ